MIRGLFIDGETEAQRRDPPPGATERGAATRDRHQASGAGALFNQMTQRLAWAVEFLNIPSHPERAGNRREQAEGKEEEKQETWGKRKRGGKKLKLKTDARVHPPGSTAPPSSSWANQSPPCSLSPKVGGGGGQGSPQWCEHRGWQPAVPACPVWDQDPGSLS